MRGRIALYVTWVAMLLWAAPVLAPTTAAQDAQCAIAELIDDPTPASPDREQLHQLATGNGVRVAVIDTGVAPHEQLGVVEPGADFVDPTDPAPLLDCDGHGTIVAGVIAGRDHGVAPQAQVISIRQTSGYYYTRSDDDAAAETAGSLDTLAQAVHNAVDVGADVINISVVSCVPPDLALRIDDSPVRDALARAEADNVVVVAAAGNLSDTCDHDSFVYPAHLPGVLAVAARDSPYTVADYSVSVPDHVPAVSAPGTPEVALAPDVAGFATGIYPRGTGSLEAFAGTSFAAPVVSGTVALLRERYPHATAADLRDRIIDAAEPAGGRLSPLAAVQGVSADAAPEAHPVEVAALTQNNDPVPQRAIQLGGGAVVVVALALGIAGFTSGSLPTSGAQERRRGSPRYRA